jgi:hypothetical protein
MPSVWESVKGNALYDLLKQGARLMLPFIAGFGIREWVTRYTVGLMWLAAFVVAAFVAFFQARRQRNRHSSSDALGLAALEILQDQAHGVLTEYQDLDHDFSSRVKLPLHNSSLPAFGQPWSDVDVRLSNLRETLKYITSMASALATHSKWNVEFLDLFKTGEFTGILDLTRALEQFENWKPFPTQTT